VAGFGMGAAFPTVSLVGMEQAQPGRQTQAVAAVQLTDAFGASLGPGLAGSALALATAAGSSVRTGLVYAFASCFVFGIVLLPVCRRLPDAPSQRAV
jgi:MFS family permease